MRRSTVRGRWHADGPDGRGWRAALARTSVRPRTRSGSAGRLIRVDPATGAPLPDLTRPRIESVDPEPEADHRVRLPQPVPDRGPSRDERRLGRRRRLGSLEEINRVASRDTTPNFGWPCYEGTVPPLRHRPEPLQQPLQRRRRHAAVLQLRSWRQGRSGRAVPTDERLVDHAGWGSTSECGSVGCLSRRLRRRAVLRRHSAPLHVGDEAGSNGLPDPSRAELFEPTQPGVVDLELGPDGALYYASLDGGQIYPDRLRVRATGAPTARVSASPTTVPRRSTTVARRERVERSRSGRSAQLRLGPRRRRRSSTTRRRAASPGPIRHRGLVRPGGAGHRSGRRVLGQERHGRGRHAARPDDRQPGRRRLVQRQ